MLTTEIVFHYLLFYRMLVGKSSCIQILIYSIFSQE